MATVKKTLSLDAHAYRLAEQAARRDGISVSAWISRAVRQEAIRSYYTGDPRSETDAETDALLDEQESLVARQDDAA